MSAHDGLYYPLGNRDAEYLSDGAYVSRDSVNQLWVSCERHGRCEAVCLDAQALRQIVEYAKKIGLMR